MYLFRFSKCENLKTNEPRHEISNNVICATSKGSDQPAHKRSLIRAFASSLNVLGLLSHWPNIIMVFLSLKGGCTGPSEHTLHCSKSHAASKISFPLETSLYSYVLACVCSNFLIAKISINKVYTGRVFRHCEFLNVSSKSSCPRTPFYTDDICMDVPPSECACASSLRNSGKNVCHIRDSEMASLLNGPGCVLWGWLPVRRTWNRRCTCTVSLQNVF